MRFVKRPFGHHNSRNKIVKKDIISTPGGIVMAHSLDEAAKISLCFDALEGKGPLASVLKTEAKKTIEKFSKANPEFKFGVVGRRMGSTVAAKPALKPVEKKKGKPTKEVKPMPKKKKKVVA
jgi:hypothetical protein